MMGKTHAATGALTGAALTAAYTSWTAAAPTPGLIVAGVAVGTGAALLPDLDHPESTATHSLGPLTRLLCLITRAVSKAAYKATGTPYDDNEGSHRTLTHTALFALAVGALTAWAASTWQAATALVLWLTTSLALRALAAHLDTSVRQRTLSTLVGVSVLSGAITATLMWLENIPATYLGVCLGAGMIVHVLGDMITKEQAPLLWPIKINGKRWWDLGPPRALLITTGDDSAIEGSIRWGCWAITGIWAALMILL